MGLSLLRSVIISVVVAFVFPASIAAQTIEKENADAVPEILISEVQSGSVESSGQEFVELYNNSGEDVEFNNWCLSYKSATGTNWTVKSQLSGTIKADEFFVVSTSGYLENSDGVLTSGLADSGGHVRLTQPVESNCDDGVTVDLVGWGNANSPEESPAEPLARGKSLQRCSQDGVITDSNNNSSDFKLYDEINPGSLAECSNETEQVNNDNINSFSCEGIVISEILPNSAGSDTGNEFIELYNPTSDYINLTGCGLQLSGKTNIYRFGDITVNPGGYSAFSDAQTGIVLPNSSGGTVYLLSAQDDELSEVTYPGDLEDDVSWAWFGGNDWQKTYSPTPASANIAQTTKPCSSPDQVRNEETGYCQSVSSSSSTEEDGLTPCKPDQERNPETNRCRKKSSESDDSLKPCKPGQERNPETNRCKSVASASSSQKSCPAGQERNPETNRCRKVAGANVANAASTNDVESVPSGSNSAWWIVGIAALVATGYGIWEWRNDIKLWFLKRFSKSTANTP